MKVFLIVVFLVLLVIFVLVELVIVDNCGMELIFESVFECVVVYDINMFEMVFVFGFQEKIVGFIGIIGWYKISLEFD